MKRATKARKTEMFGICGLYRIRTSMQRATMTAARHGRAPSRGVKQHLAPLVGSRLAGIGPPCECT